MYVCMFMMKKEHLHAHLLQKLRNLQAHLELRVDLGVLPRALAVYLGGCKAMYACMCMYFTAL